MGQAKHKVIAVTLDRRLRLIVRPRSYRIQKIDKIAVWWHGRINVGTKNGWVDVKRIPIIKEIDPRENAVSAFNRQCVERNRK